MIIVIKQKSNTTHKNTYEIQNNDVNSKINLFWGLLVRGSGCLEVLVNLMYGMGTYNGEKRMIVSSGSWRQT